MYVERCSCKKDVSDHKHPRQNNPGRDLTDSISNCRGSDIESSAIEPSAILASRTNGCAVRMLLLFRRFGRKMSMMIALLLHIAACIGSAFATSFLVFTSLRFFVGVSNMGIFLSAYVLGKLQWDFSPFLYYSLP